MTPGAIAQLACVLEATARKPGNVHRFADFEDLGYLDFLLSARAIAGPLDHAVEVGVGRTVLGCVRASRLFVSTNTNLGMILLLAPLAAVPHEVDLRVGLQGVLESTTLADARFVYEAIQLASPGGMGMADDQDVREMPTVTLLDAMRLAAERDSVARQYSNGFFEVFDVALPLLKASWNPERNWETAVVHTYLSLLAQIPDTLIARKRGKLESENASRGAREVLRAGWPEEELGRVRFREFDYWLRDGGHTRNPGTTADLVAAALFIALRDGTIRFPLNSESPRDGSKPF